MKKLFTLLFTLALLPVFTTISHAQIQGIQLQFAGDSTWNSGCTISDTSDFMIYGIAGGYPAGDSVFVEIYFGDGTSTALYTPIIQNSYFWVNSIQHIYLLPGNYSVMFIATGSDGAADTIIDNSVLISTSCGDISGKVFLDANSNCIFNTGDTPLRYVYVKAEFGGSVIAGTYTDSLGNYYLSVPTGFTYDVSIQYPGATVSCPVSGIHTVSAFPAMGKDFALLCNAAFDLTGAIYGQGFRVNNTTGFNASVINQLLTCAPPNSNVTITLDPLLSYVSASMAPTSVIGQQLTFNTGPVNTGINQSNIYITVLTLPGAVIGDTLCIDMVVSPLAGDANPSDNVVTKCMLVRNSCDPNEKYETLAGATSASILPGIELDYTIMFQNLGNDDAYDIFILDTLDANLDLSTFRMTAYSHPPMVRIINSNILKFEFKNINLPAASVNEPASHGYVSYKVNVKPGLTQGTTIDNTAHIYFDFNGAIVTNTVTHIIDLTSSINNLDQIETIAIFPNPANEFVVIALNENSSAHVSVYNISGKLVLQQNIKGTEKLNINKLESGFYMINILTNGKYISKKLVVK